MSARDQGLVENWVQKGKYPDAISPKRKKVLTEGDGNIE
jgi:hypothetical protein